MIPKYSTFKFEKEIRGTKNAPIQFLCRTEDGFASYFVKYARNENELDGLIYELVCGTLCRKLDITTPDTALIEIKQGTLPFDRLSGYQNQVYEGLITFGSQKIDNVVELSRMEVVKDKHSFNRYHKPVDLLKLAIFDLWVRNRDRSEDNFNILIKQGNEKEFIAIDHFNCFSNLDKVINPYVPTTLLGARFTRKLLHFYEEYTLLSEVESFIERCYNVDIENTLHEIFPYIPDSWGINENLKEQLIVFLGDAVRLEKIKDSVTDFIRFNLSKR